MAKTITTRISLEGGEQVKNQLIAIGKAGAAAYDALAGAGAATAGLKSVGTSIEGIATRVANLKSAASGVSNSLSDFGSSAIRTSRNLLLVGGAITGVVVAISAMIKASGEEQESLQNTADTLGISVQKYKELSDVLELQGIPAANAEKSLLKLAAAVKTSSDNTKTYQDKLDAIQKKVRSGVLPWDQYRKAVADVNEEQSKSDDVFKRLGVAIRDGNGNLRDLDEIARDAGVALKELPAGTQKAQDAMALFGTRNAKVSAALSLTREEFEKMAAEARRIAPALNDEARAALDKTSDSITQLGKASGSTRDMILAAFAPSFTVGIQGITDAVVAARAVMVSFAQDLAAKALPIIKDVVAALSFKDDEVNDKRILAIRDAFIQFGKDAYSAVFVVSGALKVLVGVADQAAAAVNKIFGTNLTGTTLLLAGTFLKITGVLGTFVSGLRLLWSVGVLVTTSFTTIIAVAQVLVNTVIAVGAAIVGAFGAVPVAIAAVGFAIGFLVVTIVQKLGGVQAIITRVGQGFVIFGQVILGVVTAIVGFFVNGFAAIGAAIAAAFTSIVALAVSVGTGIITAFQTAFAAIVAAFTSLPEALAAIWQTLVGFATAAWQTIADLANSAVQAVVGFFTAGFSAITSKFTALADFAKSVFASIIAGARAVAEAIGSAGGGSTTNKASGGYIRGPGGPTSDSIPARLSNGEFVIRAKAVKKFGVGFFARLNGLREPLRGAAEGFANGGLVSAMSPVIPALRFADGGLAQSGGVTGRPVNLNIGGEQFQMVSQGNTADRLQRFATGKRLRSTGRRPTWQKG
jgi:hypothetical protein